MKKIFSKTSLTLGVLMMATCAQAADSWVVEQTVTPKANTTMTQNGTVGGDSANMTQGLNTIKDVTTITTNFQSVVMGDKSLYLKQDKALATSTQAANFIKAGTIGGTGDAFEQKLASSFATADASAVKLEQPAGVTGATNSQAVNSAEGTTEVKKLKQSVTAGASKVELIQAAAGTGNIQAVNKVNSPTITSLEQAITVTGGTLDLTQSGATASNTQAGNVAKSSGTGGTVALIQGVTAQTINLTQSTTGGGNLQAVNSADGTELLKNVAQTTTAEVYSLTQSTQGENNTMAINHASTKAVTDTTGVVQKVVVTDATGDSFTGTQTGAGGAATTSATMAANYLKSTGGVIQKATQEFTNAHTTATLTQNNQTSGVQALNLIDVQASGGVLTSGSQKVSVANLTMNQGQTSAVAKTIQAGNAVLSSANTGDANVITQEVTAVALNMKQDRATNSFQACNFVGRKPSA